MKGGISIGDFIHQVKQELKEAQSKPEDGFYELNEVTLEINFNLNIEGESKFSLYVLGMGVKSNAQQSHKVTLKLKPYTQTKSTRVASSGAKAAKKNKPSPPPKGARPVYGPKHLP